MTDDAAADLCLEFDQMIDESRARIAPLTVAAQRSAQKASELTASMRKTWQRRVQALQNRSMAQQAADLMDG